MTGETVLTNARLVLADEVVDGALVLRDGAIAAVDEGRSAPPGALDCGGDWLAPGLVELHTDNLERHLRPRPSVVWPPRAAVIAHDAELASVGVTTVFDALRVGSVVSEARGAYRPYARPLADEIRALRDARALKIDHRLHLRAEICSETLSDELDAFVAADGVGVVSLMDHTPGARQFADLGQLRTYLQGKHAMTEADFIAHVARLRAISAEYAARHEADAVAAARRLGAVLASHDDTDEDHVAVSARHGATLAEFPTTLAAARACAAHGVAVMMGAPNLLRGGSHSGNVAAGDLAAAGLLDILSSDYAPSSLLAGAVALGRASGAMAAGLAAATLRPAQAAGLTDRGRLAAGLRADVIRFGEIGDTPVLRGVWAAGRRVA